MRISRMHAVAAFLLTATVTAASAQQLRQPAQGVSSNTHQSAVDVYGEPKTRAEVRADLELWKRAGLDDFWRGENTPDTFSREYRTAYAEYVRMRSGPEYQQEVERQSAM
ncbi:DUF4148 domain-containing protein [Paracandidimonas lactea]|uniref:DUF4148 domain-containing protein n=1 Tax=Paracandidimonas lactea TaxID=2895524 RepID=UPI001F2B0DC1|nr:DUF4148 domain-containing protein [Paracandidimonas lactea]